MLDGVSSVAFSPAGTTLATLGGDGPVILWDLREPAAPTRIGEPLTGQSYGVSSVAFSPAGTTLATAGGDGTVILWDLREPAALTRIGEPLTGHNYGVSSVAFSPADRTTLATAGGDGAVILWDLSESAARPSRRSPYPSQRRSAAQSGESSALPVRLWPPRAGTGL